MTEYRINSVAIADDDSDDLLNFTETLKEYNPNIQVEDVNNGIEF